MLVQHMSPVACQDAYFHSSCHQGFIVESVDGKLGLKWIVRTRRLSEPNLEGLKNVGSVGANVLEDSVRQFGHSLATVQQQEEPNEQILTASPRRMTRETVRGPLFQR